MYVGNGSWATSGSRKLGGSAHHSVYCGFYEGWGAGGGAGGEAASGDQSQEHDFFGQAVDRSQICRGAGRDQAVALQSGGSEEWGCPCRSGSEGGEKVFFARGSFLIYFGQAQGGCGIEVGGEDYPSGDHGACLFQR